MDITKAVIPAAGFGSRFLPFTKSVPKEMLPLPDKPAIQYVVEEGIASEIKQFVMITSRHKQSIEHHFDAAPELETFLREQDKETLIHDIERVIRSAEFIYARQADALGLGHAVWLARHMIGKEHFGIMLPDDILVSKQPALEQLMRIARQEKGSVIAVQEVPSECTSSYGIIDIKKQITPHLVQVGNLIEKPAQKDAPSNLAVIGRYILSNKIFPALEQINTYSVGELQLTDAISCMMQNNEKVFAYKVQGVRYDIGTPLGWIKTIIALSLQHKQYRPYIKQFIDDLDTPKSFMYNKTKNIEHSR